MQVDDRCRVGERRRDGVMIGHHRIHPERLGIGDLFDGGDPVVDGDDQLDALFTQAGDGLFVHAVTLGLTRGNIIHGVGADIA